MYNGIEVHQYLLRRQCVVRGPKQAGHMMSQPPRAMRITWAVSATRLLTPLRRKSWSFTGRNRNGNEHYVTTFILF